MCAAYLGLEKSCGRSLGPSGPLFLPRSAELLFTGMDGGRMADMALEALVLRNRLPASVVLGNFRTRSSIVDISIVTHPMPFHCTYLTSHSTPPRTHSTQTSRADQSCPWCGFLSGRAQTLSTLPEHPNCADATTNVFFLDNAPRERR